ncbi:hypothetical protein PJI16_12730 [Nitrospira sp. MA-1]|nr:hypothetical protein [Nitrospira sp. MA-1]
MLLRFFVMPGFGPAAEVLLFRQKDPKPSDAPSGLMRGDGRQVEEGGPTHLAQTRSARESERPPVGQPAGVGPREQPQSRLRHNCRVGIVVMFCDAGFRPGSRPTFVSAKVGKTSDAPPGRIGLIGRGGGRSGLTRGARTSPSRKRASIMGRVAGVEVLN